MLIGDGTIRVPLRTRPFSAVALGAARPRARWALPDGCALVLGCWDGGRAGVPRHRPAARLRTRAPGQRADVIDHRLIQSDDAGLVTQVQDASRARTSACARQGSCSSAIACACISSAAATSATTKAALDVAQDVLLQPIATWVQFEGRAPFAGGCSSLRATAVYVRCVRPFAGVTRSRTWTIWPMTARAGTSNWSSGRAGACAEARPHRARRTRTTCPDAAQLRAAPGR